MDARTRKIRNLYRKNFGYEENDEDWWNETIGQVEHVLVADDQEHATNLLVMYDWANPSKSAECVMSWKDALDNLDNEKVVKHVTLFGEQVRDLEYLKEKWKDEPGIKWGTGASYNAIIRRAIVSTAERERFFESRGQE